MATVVGIAGSLRRGSYNAALLRAATDAAPPGLLVDFGSIQDIPLYDGDLEESQGIPEAVAALKERVAASDGLLIVTPEYNGSMPGVLKNALDWLSRPPSDTARVFGGKPVGMMGATPGGVGTRLAQTAWLPVLRALGLRPWFGRTMYVGGASRLFDGSGALTDEATRKRLEEYMAGFAAFVNGER